MSSFASKLLYPITFHSFVAAFIAKQKKYHCLPLTVLTVANRYPSLSLFLPRDLLESGIGKEEKAMKKLQSVLTRLKARQAHQASLYHEAKAELHNFRVGWILSEVVFRFISVIPNNNGADVDNTG